jgi:hypothetical protein
MDLQQIADNLPDLYDQLNSADQRAEAAIERAHAAEEEANSAIAERNSLLKIIEGIEGWLGRTNGSGELVVAETDTTARPESSNPQKLIRGRNAVRRILRENGRAMKPRELVKAVIERGWIDADARDPAAAVRQAARRLIDDGEVERLPDGTYRYRDSPATPDDATKAARQQQLLDEERGADS